MNRFLIFCLLLSVAILPVRADDTFHNVYHSLKRFFTGEPKQSSAAPRKKHSARTHSDLQADSEKSSNHPKEARTIVLPQATTAPGPSAANPEEKKSVDPKPPVSSSAEAKPAETASPDIKSLAAGLGETKSEGKGAANIKTAEPSPKAGSSPVLRSVQ